MMIPRSLIESTVGKILPFKSRGSDDANFLSKVIDLNLSILTPFYSRRPFQQSDQHPIVNEALSKMTVIYCRLQRNSRKSCQFCREEH